MKYIISLMQVFVKTLDKSGGMVYNCIILLVQKKGADLGKNPILNAVEF